MAAIKIIVAFVCAIVVAQAEDHLIPLKSVAINPLLENSISTDAIVLGSNLPASEQNYIANQVQTIFNTISDNLQRATRIQSIVTSYKPGHKVNVVIGYQAVAYYQNFYISLLVNNVYVIVWGLRC